MHQNAALRVKHVYCTLIERQVLTTCSLISQFCFLGTTTVLLLNVWFNEQTTSSHLVWKSNLGLYDDTLYFTSTNTTQVLGCFVNPFPNKPWFLRVCCTSLLKTQWEKEKLLVMSNFFFSHCVFYLFGELSAIFIKSKIVVCRHFEFGRVKKLSFGKGLKQLLDAR